MFCHESVPLVRPPGVWSATNVVTKTQVKSALHLSGVAKSSTSFGWVKTGNSPLPDGSQHCVIPYGM